ncbi:uncharacterized protein [Mytilus edulis]|uniref:uncharacterized protein n=1 Tax=Mytilus edulis TaxID=6550 RepID=UPI0039F10F79
MDKECMQMNITSAGSGYDNPVFGVGHNCFNVIHVTAIVCLLLSLSSAVGVIILLYKSRAEKSFMKGRKHERFLLYRCICDISYSFVHTSDHAQTLITEDHVRPSGLCTLYAMLIVITCISETLFSLASAFNAFLSVYFRKNVNFGNKDWKLILLLGVRPFLVVVIMTSLHVFGPNGFFCAFDSVKGVTANAVMSTGFTSAILVANTTFYVLTWYRIYTETKELKTQLDKKGSTRRATLKSAKAMCLFVVVYIIQWTPLSVNGTWQLISDVPFGLFLAVVIITNLSGVFSGTICLFNRSNRISVSN